MSGKIRSRTYIIAGLHITFYSFHKFLILVERRNTKEEEKKKGIN